MFTSIVRANGGTRGKPDPSKPMDPAKTMQAARQRLKFLEQKDPKNGVCWETSIPVKKLGLKGELEEADSQEDGAREVPVSALHFTFAHNAVAARATC